MALKSYKSSAPGSMMLFGEHAVLHGKWSIVTAINKRINVTLIPRSDDKIILKSLSLKKRVEFFISDLKKKKKYFDQYWQFVLAVILQKITKVKSGFELLIKSEFEAIGLGSSAAVVVATLGVLNKYLNLHSELKAQNLFYEAKKIICKVQGKASGADVAASVFGGIVAYKAKPFCLKKINFFKLPLTVIYSGKKVATSQVLEKVNNLAKSEKKIFQFVYDSINLCTLRAISALKKKDLVEIGKVMNIHQGFQDALGVNNDVLSQIIYALRDCPGILGAKISGAGLGDCVIGLGVLKRKKDALGVLKKKKIGVRQIEVSVSKDGVKL